MNECRGFYGLSQAHDGLGTHREEIDGTVSQEQDGTMARARSATDVTGRNAKKRYTKPRTAVPAAVKRVVFLEARGKCIICEAPGQWQWHHIDKNRENHTPENIAYLCPTDHSFADSGEIDRKTLLTKKAKLREENEELQRVRIELAQYKG